MLTRKPESLQQCYSINHSNWDTFRYRNICLKFHLDVGYKKEGLDRERMTVLSEYLQEQKSHLLHSACLY